MNEIVILLFTIQPRRMRCLDMFGGLPTHNLNGTDSFWRAVRKTNNLVLRAVMVTHYGLAPACLNNFSLMDARG